MVDGSHFYLILRVRQKGISDLGKDTRGTIEKTKRLQDETKDKKKSCLTSRHMRKKIKENIKDSILFKEEQEGMPWKRSNWNRSNLGSVLNGFLNFRPTSRGAAKSCGGQIIPVVINMFIKEKVLR